MSNTKSISTFIYLDKIIISPKKRALSGLEYIKEPSIIFSEPFNFEKLGACILDSLDKYEIGAKELKRGEYKLIFNPILKSVNCKTYDDFWKKIKHVPIRQNGQEITFFSTQNFGPGGGYTGQEMPKTELLLDQVTNKDLGMTLMKAFEMSTIEI